MVASSCPLLGKSYFTNFRKFVKEILKIIFKFSATPDGIRSAKARRNFTNPTLNRQEKSKNYFKIA